MLLAVLLVVVASLRLSVNDTVVASWWPAAGLAAGLLLVRPRREWPVLGVGVAVVATLGSVLGGRALDLSLWSGPISALEAVVFAALMTRWTASGPGGRARLQSLAHVGRWLLAAGLTAALVGAVAVVAVGTTSAWAPWPTIRNVLPSHASALLVLTPLFLLAPGPGDDRQTLRVREVLPQVLVTAGVVGYAFAPWQQLPLGFLVVGVLLWAALTLPQRWLAVEVLVVACTATILTGIGATVPLNIVVAEHRAALQAALDGRETYRRGLQESVVGVLLLRPGPDGPVVLEANLPAARLLGRPAEELLHRPWRDGLGEHAVTIDAAVDDMVGGRTQGWQQELWLQTEPPRCAEVALSWVPDTAEGSLIVVQMVDLTDARTSQQALEAEREYVASLMAATTSTAIVGTDTAGRIQYVNTGLEQMLEVHAGDLVGLPVDVLLSADQDPARAAGGTGPLGRMLFSTHADGLPGRKDWWWARRGSTEHVSVAVATSVVRGRDGETAGYLLVADDVTERRRTEQVLVAALEREHQAVARLEELDRSKTAFVLAVTHEFRTPLTAVLGFSQLLASEGHGTLTDEQRDVVRRVLSGAQRLRDLVEQVLTLSQVEAGVEARRVPVDLREVAATADVVRQVHSGRAPRLRVRAPEDQRTVVLGDPAQLQQVLDELVANAVHASPSDGAVTIDLRTEEDEVVLRVSDEGPGIEEDELPHVLDAFYRSRASVEAEAPGTGLGLAVVRALAQAHDGDVAVRNREGGGAVATVRLPAAPTTSADQPSRAATRESSSSTSKGLSR